jgi:hypothetical protein
VPAAAHSLRERRGAMARPRRQLAYRGYRVTPMVAHMLARAVGAADCSTTEKRRRERAGCGAQSARASGSDGATAQAACVPWVSRDTDGCTHVGTGGRRGRLFDHRAAAARIEPLNVRTCMRMPVRLCAKEYRFERQVKCGMERAVATVGCRVKAISKGGAACVSCEHACTGLLHA